MINAVDFSPRMKDRLSNFYVVGRALLAAVAP